MNFPNVINPACIPTTPPPPDTRCSDPTFALLNPDICAKSPLLRIKPGILLTCALGSVQFEAFTVTDGAETALTTGVTWTVSDPTVALIGVTSGNATGIAPGTVTITATYQGLTATSTLTVLPGMNCCSGNDVATMLVVDKSHSMSLQFGAGYATKQAFADSVASNYAIQTNTQKDLIGLIEFDSAPTTDSALTSDASTVSMEAAGIINSVNKTGIGVALQAAVTALASSQANTKVIVLITDGEDQDTNPANDPVPIATAFKATGGIMFCVGVRSHGTAFNTLGVMATGGFFVNCYPQIVAQALNWIYGLKGYICAGNCSPPGNNYVNEPAFNYSAFANWNAAGKINLLGPGLLDPLPGNGLYVSLGFGAQLTSKLNFMFAAGKQYQLSFFLAGNQIQDFGTQNVTVQVGDGTQFKQVIILPSFNAGLTKYSFNFTPVVNVTAPIIISSNAAVTAVVDGIYCGPILNDVNLYDITDLNPMFDDNFDAENLQFVPAACGVSAIFTPSAATCEDADANAFTAAANITDTTQKSAICALVTSLKSAGLWTAMDAIYPMVGGNALAHSLNLRNLAKYQVVWVGGLTHDSNGVTGDGVSGYGDTGFNPSTAAGNFSLNSAAMGVYCRTAAPNDASFMGAWQGIASNTNTKFLSTGANMGIVGWSADHSFNVPASTYAGIHIGSRTASNSMTGYTPSNSVTDGSYSSNTLVNLSLFIFAQHNLAGPSSFSNADLAFAFIGTALSGGQVTTLKGIIQTYQTALGRQV